MHLSDALISPTIAGITGIISVAAFVVAAKKVKKEKKDNIIPLMGVMGAFIFTAQMINFTIPGTGSSGHIIGGVLLASILGPWAAFITLSSVLVVQCLLFADGGLMALGCNILNMGIFTCLIAYPLIYRNIIKKKVSFGKILWVSILTCVIGLELGAFAVTIETEASGITALPINEFLLFMLPIHLLIGIGEGIATAMVIYFIQKYKPDILIQTQNEDTSKQKTHIGKTIIAFALIALLLGTTFTWVASSQPDGLEWSITKTSGVEELENPDTQSHIVSEEIINNTALLPDYNSTFSGIIGGILVVVVTWGITSIIRVRKSDSNFGQENSDKA